jgi:hypothetical protein
MAKAHLYPNDFDSENKMKDLTIQLDNFLENACDHLRLSILKGVSDVYKKLVETNKHTGFPLVFFFVKLALILPGRDGNS